VGKSTFASQAPSPVFIPTEDGLGEIDCHSFDLAKHYDDVLVAIGQLYSEDHNYKTVCIDSVDWLESLIWEKICDDQKVDTIEIASGGYGKGYVLAAQLMGDVLTGLNAIREKNGMHVILISHGRTERHADPEQPDYDRWAPKLHKHVSAKVMEWCDEVLFAMPKVFTTTEEGTFGKKSTKALSTGQRVLRTIDKATARAKNRLGLPEEIELKWQAYADHFSK